MSYVYSRFLALLVKLTEAKGLSFEGLVRNAGIDLELLTVDDAKIPADKYFLLQKGILRQSGNSDFGLHTGRLFYMENFHLYMYVASTTGTLREWINLLPRVPTVMGDVGKIVTRVEREHLIIEAYVDGLSTAKRSLIMDALLTSTVLLMDGFSLLPVRPARISFTHAQPSDTKALNNVFQAPLHFNQAVNAIYYHKDILNFQLLNVSTQVYDSVKEEIKEFLSDFSWQSDSFTVSLYLVVRRQLTTGNYSLTQVAQLLNMSARTVQRRLQERGISYQRFLQEVKASVAVKYLQDKRFNIIQIATFLGYSDSSAFSTAFKSWYGCTPREFRNTPDQEDQET